MLSSTMPKETIAAIATAQGEGAVGIVRLSGPQSFAIAKKICGEGDYESHRVYLRDFIDPSSGRAIDQGLMLFMKGPHSFTGEDVVELQGHGGLFLMRELLRCVVAAGARPSEPGEFSLRAYHSGRLDLAQAESIAALISARSQQQLQIAHRQLKGELSSSLRHLRGELIEIAAILEAWVDFPEEGLEFTSMSQLLEQLHRIEATMRSLVASYDEGQRAREGLCVVLAGLPNGGKSSLLNALLGHDRAIVHEAEGTTRDALEEELFIGQVPLRLIDTAGLRQSDDPVEQEGIARSYRHLKEADLVLFVHDAMRGAAFDRQERLALEGLAPEKTLLVLSKIDLRSGPEDQDLPPRSQELQAMKALEVSTKTGEGLEALKSAIKHFFEASVLMGEDATILVHLRHKEAIERALVHLGEVLEGLAQERSAELVCADMKEALGAMTEVFGGDLREEILDSIFSKFCIGK